LDIACSKQFTAWGGSGLNGIRWASGARSRAHFDDIASSSRGSADGLGIGDGTINATARSHDSIVGSIIAFLGSLNYSVSTDIGGNGDEFDGSGDSKVGSSSVSLGIEDLQ